MATEQVTITMTVSKNERLQDVIEDVKKKLTDAGFTIKRGKRRSKEENPKAEYHRQHALAWYYKHKTPKTEEVK
jgi:hypothetical protein